jgi:DNA-binding FadR family transcriptional regulator
LIADDLREGILARRIDDGERLPPLERLQDHFGVSAPTMRESLRILEAEGLLVVQRGGIGGAIVRRPTPRTAAYMLAMVLRSQNTVKRDVAEAIAMLEPLCAMRAARRPDRDHVARELRKLNASAREVVDGNAEIYNNSMLEFHHGIVSLSGSDTLTLVTQALEDIWQSDVETWVAMSATHGQYPDTSERLAEIEQHEQIVDLIEAGDEPSVAEAMRSHIDDRVFRAVIDNDDAVDPKAVRAGHDD